MTNATAEKRKKSNDKMALEAMAINYKINSFLVSAIIETTNGQTLSK